MMRILKQLLKSLEKFYRVPKHNEFSFYLIHIFLLAIENSGLPTSSLRITGFVKEYFLIISGDFEITTLGNKKENKFKLFIEISNP